MTVPHNQSQLLYDALKQVKVKAKFQTIKGGGHSFREPEVDKMVNKFFKKNLKPKNSKPLY